MKTCCHTVVTCLIVTQWHTMASGRTWLDERATRMASAWTGTGFLAWQDPHYYRPLCRLKLLGLRPFLVLSLGLSLFLYFPFNFHWHVDKRVLTQYDWAVKWNPVDSNLFYVDTEVLPHSTSFLCLPHLHLFSLSLSTPSCPSLPRPGLSLAPSIVRASAFVIGSGEGESHGSPTPTQISQRGFSGHYKTITCSPDRRAVGLAYSPRNLVRKKKQEVLTQCNLQTWLRCHHYWLTCVYRLSGLCWIRTIAIKVTLAKRAQLPQGCSRECNMCVF